MSQQDLAATKADDGKNSKSDTLPLESGLVCPACAGKLIRRSMRRSVLDHLKSLVGLWPYRCILCNTRFSGPQDLESIARHNKETDPGSTDQKFDAS